MGIPFYFKKLTSDFEGIVVNKRPFSTCDRLFLDFNCAIHKCVYALKNDETNSFITQEEFDTLLIEKCKNMIDDLYQLILPSMLIYISIDGVAPMAKIAQQRKRRYFSDWKRNELLEKCTKLKKMKECEKLQHEWNSNAVTPGTVFMKKLVHELTLYADRIKSQYDIDVILNHEFGEGEHNICNYIENNKNYISNDVVDVIYGMDADMILLGMLSYNCDNTYLLRESVTDDKQFVYMILHKTSKQIYDQFCDFVECPRDDLNKSYYIKCYVFLTFILGNDFLPNMTYISLRNDGLIKLLTAYQQTFNKVQRHIFDEHNQISLSFLSCLFENLSRNEDNEFMNCENNYYAFTNKKYTDKNKSFNFISNETKNLELYPIKNKFPMVVNVGKSGWRRDYYYHLFEKNLECDIINRTCVSYIQGLIWVANYYFDKNANDFWFYPYMYSPTCVDVSNFLNLTNDLNDIKFCKQYERCTTALDQLLMVLPPSSSYLIPDENYREYYTNIKLGYVHLFPSSFDIVTYMKYQLHECNGHGLNLVHPILIKSKQ
jgi:5'-3' exonuclease